VRFDGRLKRLEELACASRGTRSPHYELESYFRALANLERKEADLPPLPYTEEADEELEAYFRQLDEQRELQKGHL
jgi:hypothetical protein